MEMLPFVVTDVLQSVPSRQRRQAVRMAQRLYIEALTEAPDDLPIEDWMAVCADRVAGDVAYRYTTH